MNITNKLKELLYYYQTSRQVGHTTVALEHVDDAIVLCNDRQHAKTLMRDFGTKKTKFIALTEADYCFRGHRKPLVIDNYTMMTLLTEALREIHDLEVENLKFKYKIEKICKTLME